jgi:hypothetical protein
MLPISCFLTAAIQAFARPALAGRIYQLSREKQDGKNNRCYRNIFHVSLLL